MINRTVYQLSPDGHPLRTATVLTRDGTEGPTEQEWERIRDVLGEERAAEFERLSVPRYLVPTLQRYAE